jgi:ABC-type Mn2+/Zn2+ transport system permease subunit
MTTTPVMSRPRLLGLGIAGFVTATIVSVLTWIPVVLAGLSGICGDSTSDAECSARQSGAEADMVIAGLFFGMLALGVLFLVVRAVSRPQGRRNRWYLLGAALLLPMPTLSVLIPPVETPAGRPWTLILGATAAIAVVWTLMWCFAMDRIMSRASAAVAGDQLSPAS